MVPGLLLTSESLNELATALAQAQGEIKDATKDSINPHLKSKYADLAEVLQTARPVLSKYGLSVIQGVEYAENRVIVTTRLMHKSGQWVDSALAIPVGKQDAQGVGAATTYGRRYGLAAMVGMSQDDDDGESIKQAKKASSTVKPSQYCDSDLSDTVVAKLTDAFNAVTADTDGVAKLKALTAEYTALTPMEQNRVLPAAKAARTRLEEAKLLATK